MLRRFVFLLAVVVWHSSSSIPIVLTAAVVALSRPHTFPLGLNGVRGAAFVRPLKFARRTLTSKRNRSGLSLLRGAYLVDIASSVSYSTGIKKNSYVGLS